MKAENSKSVLSEINVTPLVDVMLVLLIIFMVTAPLLKQGVDIELPKANGKEITSSERLVIVLSKDGTIKLNDQQISMPDLVERIKAGGKATSEAYLEADNRVEYGQVVKLMAEIREAGIERIGMVTEPRIASK